MKALKAQGMSRDNLPYKAPFQPWGSWFAFIATAIITLFKGFDAFIPFKVDSFITWVLVSIFLRVDLTILVLQELHWRRRFLHPVARI